MSSCTQLTPSEEPAPAPIAVPDAAAAPALSPQSTPTADETKNKKTKELPAHDSDPVQPTTSPTPLTEVMLKPSLESIQNELVKTRCLSCHQVANAQNRFVDLRDLNGLFTTQAPNDPPGEARKVIRVGCPDNSMFYLSIKNNQMPPPGATAIADANRETIKHWIQALLPGLPGETRNCSDEPPD